MERPPRDRAEFHAQEAKWYIGKARQMQIMPNEDEIGSLEMGLARQRKEGEGLQLVLENELLQTAEKSDVLDKLVPLLASSAADKVPSILLRNFKLHYNKIVGQAVSDIVNSRQAVELNETQRTLKRERRKTTAIRVEIQVLRTEKTQLARELQDKDDMHHRATMALREKLWNERTVETKDLNRQWEEKLNEKDSAHQKRKKELVEESKSAEKIRADTERNLEKINREHETAVADMSNKIQRLGEEIDRLTKIESAKKKLDHDKIERDKFIVGLEARLATTMESNATLKANAERIETSGTTVSQEHHKRLEEARERITQLSVEKAKLEENKRSTDTAMKLMTEKLEIATDARVDAETTRDSVRQELSTANGKVQDLYAQIAEANRKRDEELKNVKLTCEREKDVAITDLKEKHAEQARTIDTEHENVVKEVRRELGTELEKVRTARNKAQEQAASIQNKMNEAEAATDAEIQRLEGTIQQCNAGETTLTKDLEQAQTKADRDLAAAKQECKERDTTIKQLKKNLSDKSKAMESIQKKLQDSALAVESGLLVSVAYEADIDTLTEQKQDLDKLYRDARWECEGFRSIYQDAKDSLDAIQDTSNDQGSTIATLTEQKQKLSDELQRERTQHGALQQKEATVDNELNTLRPLVNKNKELDLEVADLRTTVSGFQEANTRRLIALRDACVELKLPIEELDDMLSSLLTVAIDTYNELELTLSEAAERLEGIDLVSHCRKSIKDDDVVPRDSPLYMAVLCGAALHFILDQYDKADIDKRRAIGKAKKAIRSAKERIVDVWLERDIEKEMDRLPILEFTGSLPPVETPSEQRAIEKYHADFLAKWNDPGYLKRLDEEVMASLSDPAPPPAPRAESTRNESPSTVAAPGAGLWTRSTALPSTTARSGLHPTSEMETQSGSVGLPATLTGAQSGLAVPLPFPRATEQSGPSPGLAGQSQRHFGQTDPAQRIASFTGPINPATNLVEDVSHARPSGRPESQSAGSVRKTPGYLAATENTQRRSEVVSPHLGERRGQTEAESSWMATRAPKYPLGPKQSKPPADPSL